CTSQRVECGEKDGDDKSVNPQFSFTDNTRCVDIVCWFETGQSADRVIYGDTFRTCWVERGSAVLKPEREGADGALHPGNIVLLTDPLRRCGEYWNYVQETKARQYIVFSEQKTS
ncbi:hypothetical protein J6590_085430, partial [Homalodisca vitripennis]